MIRAFWVLHRAIFRVTGGRIGLWRPRAGKRFGVMGLRTTGRRSGRDRTVIVGYFEDGTNLVTLAMNGWAGTEPAWWLNLKSRPDATVVLRPGPGAVQARTAEETSVSVSGPNSATTPVGAKTSMLSPNDGRSRLPWSSSRLVLRMARRMARPINSEGA